jgi:CHAT domain-containing protein/predicted negative regulator of RcsB-dependent stress response
MNSALISGGEDGLRAWVKANKNRIGDDFVFYAAQLAASQGSEKLQRAAEILASEKGNAYLGEGDIYLRTGENAKALTMYEKALPFFEKARDPIGQGNVYRREGDIYLNTSDYAKALAMYEKALPFFEKAQDPLGQGNVYKSEGDIYLYTGENAKALAMYEKALPFYEKAQDPLGQGGVYRGEGEIYLYEGENAKALAMYEKALLLYEKAQDSLGQGGVYRGEGDIFLYTGENAKALAMYEKALPFYEKAQHPIGQGNVYAREGDIFFYTGENAKALAMYEKALPFYEKAQEPLGQGNVYQSEGDIFLYTGENAKALAMYEKALPFYEKAQDPRGQGNVYRSEGNIYLRTGENAKALAMYEKALPFYEKAQDPLGQGNVYRSEGDIYLRTGENAKALAMYEKALPFYEKAQDPLGQGNVYLREGDIFFYTGENAKALAMYEKALPFYEKGQGPSGQGNVYKSEGDIYLQTGENAKALAMYEKALPFYERDQDPLGQGTVYQGEGDIFLQTGENAKALAFYEKAEELYGKIGDLEDSAYACIGKAEVLDRQGQKAEALQLYEAGLENLEKVRAQTIIPALKKSFMQKVYDNYDDAALFMLGNGYPQRGFRIVESMKARLFLDQLAENLASVDKGLDPALKERQDALTGKLSALAEAMEQAGGEKDEAKLSELTNERRKVEAEFENLQIDIRIKNPAYAALRYPEPVSLGDLQKKVLRLGEVLVEYYLSGEKAFAFAVTKEGFKTVELPAGSKAIQSTVQGYLAWIGNPYYRPAGELNRLAAGAALYGLLLKPLESNLSEGATIIVVPDGELAKLPFESLVVSLDPASKRPFYLLEKYPVKYIQSASVLAFLRTQFEQEGATDAFIGFGDPVYDYEHFKKNEPEKGSTQELKGDILAELNRDRFARGGGTLNRLEGSGQEVTDIVKLFQAKGKAVLDKRNLNLRLDASEENAKAPAMADYGYILFSCHGLLGDGYQCLVLSQVPGAKEDGFLTLGEIMNSSYRARLVVLSACQTGKGTEERGEGVTGLTRAVMYAGSPAAVVSLWSVSDEATRELMVRFYRHMIKDGLSKDEALRRAKLEIFRGTAKFRISEESYVSISHPFFWAAFVMYGE